MAAENYAIVKVEAKIEGIVSEFNNYIHASVHVPSFVERLTGYFKIFYDGIGASSAGIVVFGNFLQSSGYAILQIHSASTQEGETGTEVCFVKDGVQSCAIVSTLDVH